jgi:hypothetical protein
MLNVSEMTVKHAKAVHTDGAPELVQAVEQGKIAVSTAATLTALPKPVQSTVVKLSDSEILTKAKEIKRRKREERETDRRERAAVAVDLLPILEKEAKERQSKLAGTRSNPGDKKEVREIFPQPDQGKSSDKAGKIMQVSGRMVSDSQRFRHNFRKRRLEIHANKPPYNSSPTVWRPSAAVYQAAPATPRARAWRAIRALSLVHWDRIPPGPSAIAQFA